MGTQNVISEELIVGSSVMGDTLNTTTVRLAVDFITRRADRNYNKYVGVAKARWKNGSATTGAIGNGAGNQRWLQVNSGSVY